MDCLRGLVGLIQGTSQNYGLPTPSGDDDYTSSSLGLWAWNLVGPYLLESGRMDHVGANADDVPIWQGLTSAYESALLQLPKELVGFLGNRLQSSFTTYTGRIGEVATTGIVAIDGTLAGYALPTRRLDGASLVISRIGLMLNTSVNALPITVTRYDGPIPVSPQGTLRAYLASDYLKDRTGEVMKVWTLDVTGNDSRTYAVTPISLPLDGSVYVISYPINGSYYPLNNRISCGCGGKDKNLNDMLMYPIGSINGDQAHGLLLDLTASCDFSGVVCDLLLNNQYTAAIGYLLYYKTGLNVLTALLGGQLSPAVQIQTADLVAKRTEWESEMSKYLTWMTTEWKTDLLPGNRCYVCNKSGNIYRGTIRL